MWIVRCLRNVCAAVLVSPFYSYSIPSSWSTHRLNPQWTFSPCAVVSIRLWSSFMVLSSLLHRAGIEGIVSMFGSKTIGRTIVTWPTFWWVYPIVFDPIPLRWSSFLGACDDSAWASFPKVWSSIAGIKEYDVVGMTLLSMPSNKDIDLEPFDHSSLSLPKILPPGSSKKPMFRCICKRWLACSEACSNWTAERFSWSWSNGSCGIIDEEGLATFCWGTCWWCCVKDWVDKHTWEFCCGSVPIAGIGALDPFKMLRSTTWRCCGLRCLIPITPSEEPFPERRLLNIRNNWVTSFWTSKVDAIVHEFWSSTTMASSNPQLRLLSSTPPPLAGRCGFRKEYPSCLSNSITL